MGGTLAAMKAKAADEERAEAKNAFEKLGGTVREAKTFALEINGEILERTIVLIDKTAPTPAAYPRNYSQISKKPL
jgi:16S rRNA (guanine527-N7)-methyltransferase